MMQLSAQDSPMMYKISLVILEVSMPPICSAYKIKLETWRDRVVQILWTYYVVKYEQLGNHDTTMML